MDDETAREIEKLARQINERKRQGSLQIQPKRLAGEQVNGCKQRQRAQPSKTVKRFLAASQAVKCGINIIAVSERNIT